MFSITIALGNVSWRLLYKSEESAAHATSIIQDTKHLSEIRVDDDFGHSLTVPTKSLHGILVEDLDKTKMAHVELGLHQARIQAAANKAGQADPGLRASAMTNSPGVLTPMNSFRPS